jgi:UDP-N-acetylmuramate--alanine ligase
MDDFQQAFNDADAVIALPVYTAGESPIEGVTSDALVAGLKRRGHRQATVADGPDSLADQIAKSIKAAELVAGDMVICLGAGDITKMAAGLQAAVEARL